MEESDNEEKERRRKEKNAKKFNSDDSDEAIIWGQKVNLKSKELEYDLYRNLQGQ